MKSRKLFAIALAAGALAVYGAMGQVADGSAQAGLVGKLWQKATAGQPVQGQPATDQPTPVGNPLPGSPPPVDSHFPGSSEPTPPVSQPTTEPAPAPATQPAPAPVNEPAPPATQPAPPPVNEPAPPPIVHPTNEPAPPPVNEPAPPPIVHPTNEPAPPPVNEPAPAPATQPAPPPAVNQPITEPAPAPATQPAPPPVMTPPTDAQPPAETPPPTAGQPAGPAASLTLKRARGFLDLAGRGEKLGGDGSPEAVFALKLDAPGRVITGMSLRGLDGQAAAWDTSAGNDAWLLVVARKGKALNRPDGSLDLPTGDGQFTADLLAQDNNAIAGGKTKFELTITFADGQTMVVPVN